MGYILRFFNKIVGNNYILALLLFAVLIEIILLPFGIKQQKNSIKQAGLRPKEMAIRKKYAGRDDQPTKQKMTQEIQELYQKEGYNPMGGCLPLLIQFPIIIALYNIVINPLKYICGLSADAINQTIEVVKSYSGQYPSIDVSKLNATNNINLMANVKEILGAHPDAFSSVEGFSDKISSAADLPNLSAFGLDFGLIPSFKPENTAHLWLLAVPVLTFLVYFFSMKLTRKLSYQPNADDPQMGCSNKMMDIVMPLFSVYITFIVPAAVGVYWIFKSILGVIKQWILKMAMPIPTFTDEEYKAAEKEINSRVDKSTRVAKSGKVVRSLHHIDDEDFEDTAEAARRHKEALAAQEAEEAGAKQNAPAISSLIGGAAVKKDDKGAKGSKKKKSAEKTEDSDNKETDKTEN